MGVQVPLSALDSKRLIYQKLDLIQLVIFILDLMDAPDRCGPVLSWARRFRKEGLRPVAASSWRDSDQPNQPKKLACVCVTSSRESRSSGERPLSK